MFLGFWIGFVTVSLMVSRRENKRHADYLHDMAEAYNDGVRVGRATLGARLRANVGKMDQETEG